MDIETTLEVSGPTERVNIGHLITRGVPLYVREVAALIHEICVQLESERQRSVPVAAPRPDQLWVTAAGGLFIPESPASVRDADPRLGMATLIRALLPAFSEDPDFAMPASLRIVPARLCAKAGLPEIVDVRELINVIGRYETEEPRRVLEQLVSRVGQILPMPARGEEGGDSTRQAGQGTDSPAAVSIALERFDDSLDRFSSESVADPQSYAAGADDFTYTAIPLPPQPSFKGPRRSRTSAAIVRGGAALCVIGAGYAGYTFVRHSGTSAQQSAQKTDTITGRPLSALERSEKASGSSTSPPEERPKRPSAAGTAPNTTHPAPPRTETAQELTLPVGDDGAFSPSFTATGGALFFHAGRSPGGRLVEADLDARGLPFRVITVVDDGAKNYHPRLSPDERLIAFDSDRDGERGVYVARRDGTDVQRVSGAGFGSVPSWSPDMRWLAFVRGEPNHPRVWNLWLRDMKSGELHRRTSYRVGQLWGASWFPDSHRLCYSHEDRLVVLDIESGNSETFSSPRAGRLVRTPAVSPDGGRIIFQVFRDGVWLLDMQTRQMRRILDDPTAEEFAWNPEGNRVAYHSRKNGEWRIWVTTAPS